MPSRGVGLGRDLFIALQLAPYIYKKSTTTQRANFMWAFRHGRLGELWSVSSLWPRMLSRWAIPRTPERSGDYSGSSASYTCTLHRRGATARDSVSPK